MASKLALPDRNSATTLSYIESSGIGTSSILMPESCAKGSIWSCADSRSAAPMAKRTVLPACSLRTDSQSTLRIQSLVGSQSSSLSPSLYCSRYSFFTMLPTLILASTSAGFGSACALARRMLTSGTAPVPTARAAPTAAVDFSSERRVIRPGLMIGIRWSSLGFGLCRSIQSSPQAGSGQDQSAVRQRM